MPRIGSAPAACSLFFSKKDAAFRRAFRRGGHRGRIGRSDFVEVMKMRVEDRAAHKRPQNLRQQQVRNRPQLISGGGMARNIHTQAPQLLNQTPDFGAVGRNLLGDLGSADHHSGVFHQQTDDAAQPEIGRLWLVRRGCFGPRRLLASCAVLWDAEIMRELPPNNNCSFRREQLACSYPRPGASASAGPRR